MIFVISLLCAVWIFLILFFVMKWLRNNGRAVVSERVRAFSRRNTLQTQNRRMKEVLRDLLRQLGVHLQNLRQAKSLDVRMQQAGLPLLGSEFQILLFAGGLLMTVFTYLLTLQLETAMLVFPVGMGLIWFYVSRRIALRRQAFTNQLGDTLSMVANALRAGFSFLQATELISKEMKAPMGTEFAAVMREVRFGTPIETALQNMARRVQSSDFELVVTAVLIQRQVGGNLAQILDTISRTINSRVRMKREIRSLTAQGRFSSWVLSGLPIIVGLIMYVVNPRYLQPLLEEEIGHIAIAAALVMELAGFWIIRRIVDIDV